MVYSEGSETKRGLSVFGMATVSDPKTSTFHFVYVGALYQGSFAHRDDDFVAVLFADGRYNGRLTRFQEDRNTVSPGAVGVQTYERVVEADYRIVLAPWLQIQPNLQYVIRPDGTGTISNAVVVGVITKVTF
jgi:porin